jgi:parallel beta-helix repeat protein
MKKIFYSILLIIGLLSIYIIIDGHTPSYECKKYDGQWIDIYKNLQSALIAVSDHDTILIPEGHFLLNRSLLMDGKKDVVIQGAGIDKTIISFKNQKEGSEGLKVSNCVDIQLIDMTLEDAKGDLIKVTSTDGIRFSKIKVHWTSGPMESNGAYGLYPVLCNRVLIEDCIAAGASDAGIYVGQSDSVIIRNNTVYNNVAGIESENSKYVVINDNYTYHNTGGILVFDLPGLTQYGHTTLVKNNKVISNNYKNFAPKGNIVGMVPPGTGVMLLATRNITIEENEVKDNRTASCAVISYDLINAMSPKKSESKKKKSSAQEVRDNYKLDTLYDPYPNEIRMVNNQFTSKHLLPTFSSDFGLLFLTKFPLKTPAFIVDGFSRTKLAKFNLCFAGQKPSFADLDISNEFANISIVPPADACDPNKPLSLLITIPRKSYE